MWDGPLQSFSAFLVENSSRLILSVLQQCILSLSLFTQMQKQWQCQILFH
jgi:hypothetical protein